MTCVTKVEARSCWKWAGSERVRHAHAVHTRPHMKLTRFPTALCAVHPGSVLVRRARGHTPKSKSARSRVRGQPQLRSRQNQFGFWSNAPAGRARLFAEVFAIPDHRYPHTDARSTKKDVISTKPQKAMSAERTFPREHKEKQKLNLLPRFPPPNVAVLGACYPV